MNKAYTGFLINICLALTIPGCHNKQRKIIQNSSSRSVSKTDLSAFEARHADIYLPVVTNIRVLDAEKKILITEVPRPLDLLMDDYMRQMEVLGWHIQHKECGEHGFALFTKHTKSLVLYARSLSVDTTEVALSQFMHYKT